MPVIFGGSRPPRDGEEWKQFDLPPNFDIRSSGDRLPSWEGEDTSHVNLQRICGLDQRCENGPYVLPEWVAAFENCVEWIGLKDKERGIVAMFKERYRSLVGRELGHFKTTALAVKTFLNGLGYSPPAISFGERHIPPTLRKTMRSDTQVFAEELMPMLCKEMGYCDFVIEAIPFMNPSLAPELEKFYQTGMVTDDMPLLRAVPEAKEPDLVHVFESARRLRAEGYNVNIYGGGLDTREEIEIIKKRRASSLTYRELWSYMNKVGQNMALEIILIHKRNPRAKIVTFGGSLHLQPTMDAELEKSIHLDGVDPKGITDLFVHQNLKKYSNEELSLHYVTIDLVRPEQRNFVLCSDSQYMHMICSADKDTHTLVEYFDQGYNRAVVISPTGKN